MKKPLFDVVVADMDTRYVTHIIATGLTERQASSVKYRTIDTWDGMGRDVFAGLMASGVAKVGAEFSWHGEVL